MLKSVHSKSGADLKVTFRYKRELIPGESETIYLYNVIFHKIMRTLQYAQHTRKGSFFDPKAAHDIKVSKHNLIRFAFFNHLNDFSNTNSPSGLATSLPLTFSKEVFNFSLTLLTESSAPRLSSTSSRSVTA